ncbi:hypothetical protein JCM24511_01064 [Saitozyma sp. JCM 24511]|nr:hypothetical protein JCM24511_01064 [Saitozyma sp. JCM 24511]
MVLPPIVDPAGTYGSGDWTRTPPDRTIVLATDATLRDDFLLWPGFFSLEESRQLLAMALWKLDRADSTRRRRRKGGTSSLGEGDGVRGGLQDMFYGEYGFEEGHYDSVIHHYRETLLSSLPPPSSAFPDLPSLMQRIYSLLPTTPSPTSPSPPSHSPTSSKAPSSPSEMPAELPPRNTSTHLLHLAPHGEILPHVDNLEASGSVIVGVSLGSERVLRLRAKGDAPAAATGGVAAKAAGGWDVRLPSGSVYLQRDTVRYGFEHSILGYEAPESVWDGQRLPAGHRVSIMVRVSAPTLALRGFATHPEKRA